MRAIVRAGSGVMFLCSTIAPSLVAQQASAPAWQVQVMPYFWLSGMSGSLRPFAGAPTASFSRSFAESFEDVDIAFFVSAGANRGRVVMLGDLSHVATSRSGTVMGGVPADGGTTQTTLTLAGGYKASVGPHYAVDAFAGLRAYWLGADVTVAGGARSASPRRNFVDPMLGARGSAMLAPRWSTMVYGDVGGFGAGTDLTVVLSALVNYHVSPRSTVSGGYRSMIVDYNDAGTMVDVAIGGLILGASWRF